MIWNVFLSPRVFFLLIAEEIIELIMAIIYAKEGETKEGSGMIEDRFYRKKGGHLRFYEFANRQNRG